tara:strand:- start:1090 stop:1290 length:201 start_codon:yes stop_codon:yes gene_type:complete
MITSESQEDFFLSYYSYDIIKVFNDLKTKYENDNLLNKCDKNSTSDFINLLLENVDLQDMYTSKLN